MALARSRKHRYLMENTAIGGSANGALILVVDDDPTMRLLCTRILKGAGYRVLEAEGSSEAMALCASSNPPIDLILADLFLPPPDFQLASTESRFHRVNGHEMISQLLTLKKTLRALYMSSHSPENLTAQHIELGTVPFVQKPVSKERLLAHVSAALADPPLHVAETAANALKQDVQWVD